MQRRSLLFLLITASLRVLVGCSDGADVPAPEGETRIVALSPAAADILIDLGCENQIVGRHNYDSALGDAVPPVGDQSAIDYEKLLSLRPTHVIVQTESQPIPTRLTELSESAGFEVPNISTLALEDVLDSSRALEREFAPDAGLSERFAHAIRTREPEASGVGTVLVAMYCSPTVDVLGPGSAHQDIVERLGYEPAVREGKPYMPLDAEDVIALDPGVLVLIRPRAKDAKPAGDDWAPGGDDLGILTGLDLRVVNEGRVILIDDPQALTSGTSLIGVIETLSRRLAALSPLGSQHNDNDTGNTEAGPG